MYEARKSGISADSLAMVSHIGDFGWDIRMYVPIILEDLTPKKVLFEGPRSRAPEKQYPTNVFRGVARMQETGPGQSRY